MNKPVRSGSRLLLPIFAGALSPAARLLGAFILSCISLLFTFETVRAGEGAFQPGDAAVTGFSGIVPTGREPVADANPADEFFINPDGASARILALTPDGAPKGQEIKRTVRFEVKARDVGQVFGVALDDGGRGGTPNIYLAASSAFGLRIVLPDTTASGWPVRTKQGDPMAEWMPGQFGLEKGGGPGSIWKVDGATGEVSLFATIPGNSGPGLGNIAFDKAHQQFFVSDLETGLIHRISRDGAVLDAYDHGTAGHAAAGLPPLPDDPSKRMSIKSPGFDSENPETWGLTPVERRIWGVAVHGNRLYYAVWAGPQVWSVGLAPDGSIGGDARKEFDVEGGDEASPVSDIVIGAQGTVYVAQRGGLQSAYDYSVFANAKAASTQRYRRQASAEGGQPGQWVRDEYAIGLPPDFRNASGGVDLDRCEKMVWSTGDALRNVPEQAERLKANGELVIHGLQGNAVDLVRPANEPPMQAYFLDYDGQYEDAQAEGQVGGIRIYRTACERAASEPAPVYLGEAEPEYLPEGPDCIPGEPGCPIPHCPPHRPHCCPPGTYWNGHTCCRYGTRCCPPGTHWNGRVCCREGQRCCPPGTHWNGRVCCREGRHCCPPGSHWNGHVCCPAGQHCCPPGSHWNGRVCCREGQHCCPPGSHWNGRVCCPEGQHCCPPGLHWNGRTCVPRDCNTPNCCPPGSRWNPLTHSCFRPVNPGCKDGEVFVGGRCIHIRRCPDGHGIFPNCGKTHLKALSKLKDRDQHHSKRESRLGKDHDTHSKKLSRLVKDRETHSKRESRHDNAGSTHSRRESVIKKGPPKLKLPPRDRQPGFMKWKQHQGGLNINRTPQHFRMRHR